MKKLLFLCSIVLLCLSAKAQINLNDGSWKCVLDEQFDEKASYWEWDTKRFLNEGDYSWKSYLGTIAPKGEREIYQFGNCQINTADHTMHLVAYYDSINLHRNNYYLPKWMKTSSGGKGYPSSEGRLYFSGALQYNKNIMLQKRKIGCSNMDILKYDASCLHIKEPSRPFGYSIPAMSKERNFMMRLIFLSTVGG